MSCSTTSGPPGDPLTKGDGLGPVFNARSCVECHHQGGPGGGGPVANNVTVYGLATADTHGVPRAGVVHQKAVAPEFQETLDQVHTVLPHAPSIPLSVLTDRKQPLLTEVVVTQRNTPALFGDGLIDAIPDETLIAQQREHSTAARLVGLSAARDAKVRGRVARLADGRIGRFGWKLEFASLNDFVKAACANELGLANPDRPQATPLGHLAYKGKGIDLTDEQCVLMADFIRASPLRRDLAVRLRHEAAMAGRGRSCSRRSAAPTATPETSARPWESTSDLLLHDMGIELEASTGYRQLDCNVLIPLPNVPNDKFSVHASSRRRPSGGPRRSGAWPTRPPTSTTAARKRWRRRSNITAARRSTSPPGSASRSPDDRLAIVAF